MLSHLYHVAPRLLASCVAALLTTTPALACTDSHCATRHQHMLAQAPSPRDSASSPHVAVANAAVAAKTTVAISGFAFQPAVLTVAAGSKVLWINRDEEPHIVVSAGAQFPASPALDTDDSYAAVFSKPGTYTYFCSIHPHMVGTIVVR